MLLFWRALGFKFNLKKAVRRRRLLAPGVLVTLQPAKLAELRAGVEELHPWPRSTSATP